MDNKKIKCAAAGGLAGAVNGLLGTGGGMVLMPLFLRWVKLEDKKALASSVAVIAPLCIISSLIYAKEAANATPYLLGGLAGGIIAGLTFGKLNPLWLRRAFALLVLYGAVKALFQ